MIVLLIRTVIVFFALNLGLRLTGKRQIGELEISELITTLLLSELAATPILDPDVPLLHAVVPILFLSALGIVISYVTSHSHRAKAIMDGLPSVVIRDGEIDQDELEKIRMSCGELLGQLRQCGVGDPRDVRYAIFEEDGKLSVFPSGGGGGAIVHPLYADGGVCKNNLALCGKDEAWLKDEIRKSGYAEEGIFMLAATDAGEVFTVPKNKESGGRKKKRA